MWVSE